MSIRSMNFQTQHLQHGVCCSSYISQDSSQLSHPAPRAEKSVLSLTPNRREAKRYCASPYWHFPCTIRKHAIIMETENLYLCPLPARLHTLQLYLFLRLTPPLCSSSSICMSYFPFHTPLPAQIHFYTPYSHVILKVC